MANMYVHDITDTTPEPTPQYESLHCPPLMALIRENCDGDYLERMQVALESPNGAMDLLEKGFNAVLNPIRRTVMDLITRTDKREKELEKSHGDITKIKHMQTTLKVLHILQKDNDVIVKKRANQILALYDATVKLKAEYMKGYQRRKSLNGIFIWVTYICTVYYIAACTSHLAAYQTGCMKKESSILRDLDVNVKLHNDGTIRKWCQFFTSEKKTGDVKEDGGVIILTALTLGTIITAAFFLRVLVFYFYYTRMELSDYFTEQADFFKLHASEIRKDNSLEKHQQDAVINAQKTWADRFMKVADAIVVDDLKAARKTEDTVKLVNKEVNPSTIDVPNTGMEFL